jgi:DNA-binding GntR family transcriptional regulator
MTAPLPDQERPEPERPIHHAEGAGKTRRTPADLHPIQPIRPRADSPRAKRGAVGLDAPVYDAIFDAVMNRRLAPGSKLAEPALCELFGVSRTIVRKTLQRLEHDRIVEITRNKGATVARPTPEETREVFVARRAIEAAILPLAIAQATRPEIERLRKRLQAEDEALQQQDHGRWVRLAGDFHRALAELAGNSVLLRVVNELLSRCSLIVAMYEAPGESACEHDEHVQLIDCIELGDVRGAIAIMDRHLVALEARLQPQDSKPETDLASALLRS